MKTLNHLAVVFLLLLAPAAWAQPVITQQPTNQTLAVGGTLSFGVTVSGTSPVYQWFKDSRFLVDATNATLSITNAGVTNSGMYYVAVTNSAGMVISQPTSVSVSNLTLMAWGSDLYGQLGDGSYNSAVTTPVNLVSNVVTGAAGYYHSLFVKTDGTLLVTGFTFLVQSMS